MVQNGLDNFKVVTIELEANDPSENPQEIFESMNSLGKPLSLSDLVRNWMLLGLDDNEQERLYNNYWLKIERILPNDPEIFSQFIREVMQSKQCTNYDQARETNYKTLYAKFKNIFSKSNSNKNSEEILKDLLQLAPIYAEIIGHKQAKNYKINVILGDLRLISVKTSYSFLLSLLDAYYNKNLFSEQDIISILNIFRIYCLRRRVIKLTQAENKVFPQLSKYIDQLAESKDKISLFFEILSTQEKYLRLPNDTEIRRYLETANFYEKSEQSSKFYLILIEEAMTKSRPDLKNSYLQIEHIMPRTLTDDWKSMLGPNFEIIHQELIDTIGNLTLIRHNQELSNKPFDTKKEIYIKNSGLQIARNWIIERDVWNEDSIKNRTSEMISVLLNKVFPIPEKYRYFNNFDTITNKRKHNPDNRFSFQKLNLIGEIISFIPDPSIKAKVISDTQVEFEGTSYKLAPLTREIYKRRGDGKNSETYQGSTYWSYNGIKLIDYIKTFNESNHDDYSDSNAEDDEN